MAEDWGEAPDVLENRLPDIWVQRWRVLREMRSKAEKQASRGQNLLDG